MTKSKKKAGNNSNWPPVDWKTAPGFSYAHLNGFKTQATAARPSGSPQKDDSEGTVMETDNVPISIEDDFAAASKALVLSANLENQSGNACNSTYSGQSGHAPSHTDFTMDVDFDPVDLDPTSDGPELDASNFSMRDHLRLGTPDGAQAMQTGRLGESIAFKYIVGKFGGTVVKWVNEDSETGLPYDIIVGEENSREYIEVKATKSPTKDWFDISMREWQFAVEKGESFSIAHVVLLGNNVAKVSVFKNPVKLCQLGNLQLVVMMPRQQQEFSVVS